MGIHSFALSVSQYVPWDVSYLLGFSSYVKSAIGAAVNIGAQIFAVIMGVLIVISIVKRFTK